MPKILIAEDNSANVLLIRDFCKDMDFEPMVVEDGRAVVEAVRSSPPDLVFMDVETPGIDGLGATIEIRSLQNVSEQMMIIGLNSASPAITAACRIAGMNQVLTKPLQPDRLIAALRAVRAPLNLQAVVSEDATAHPAPEADEVLLQAMAELFGGMPAATLFGRLHYINAQKLAAHFAEAWPAISLHVETITRQVIEQHAGESVAYKKFGPLDFVLMTPGLTREACTAKCQSIAKEICRALAEDEAGSKFHVRTIVFNAKPVETAPAETGPARRIYHENADILAWTRLQFWPVWDTQRRKFPIHTIRGDRDENANLLPEALETLEAFGPNPYFEALDISIIADLLEHLDGYDTLEQPRLLTLPLHHHTLATLPAMTRYLRYLEKIPKKIRERLIIEIHGLPSDVRAMPLMELQKPILAHCLHTMLVVPPAYNNFALLKQVSTQIVGLELSDAAPETMLSAAKLFGSQAKAAGLTLATSRIRDPLLRDWALISCRYAVGPAIAEPLPNLCPKALFIA